MAPAMKVAPDLKDAEDFVAFVNESQTPFHAVANAKNRLKSAGFIEIREKDAWKLSRGGKYYFSRNQSALVAFTVGSLYTSGNSFAIVGAHTDSPVLKVKPRSIVKKAGFLQVGVEPYGGGLWHTWFDRDLGLAGRVFMTDPKGQVQSHLVRINKPILRVPTLAIHLDTEVREAFKFNKETHLGAPILGIEDSLNRTEPADDLSSKTSTQPLLLSAIAKEVNCAPETITDLELLLFDCQQATIAGLADDFIFSSRLDNLMMSFCAIESLARASTEKSLSQQKGISIALLADNEEVGSLTAQGADSNILASTMERLSQLEIPSAGAPSNEAFIRACRSSMILSADMAHSVHPNYTSKYDDNNRPIINSGPVIKFNANQRYATSGAGASILRRIAEEVHVPLQEFVVRNDSPCGSTIGPMLAAKLGVRTLDLGNPQTSMHSIREMAGTKDVSWAIILLQAFYERHQSLESQLDFD